MIAGGAGWWWIQKLQHGHQAAFREMLIGAVCKFFDGLEYHREPGDRFDRDRFTDLGVVGSGSFDRYEDMFEGRHRDTGFKMIDAKVVRRGQNSSTTMFDGLMFEIEVPMSFEGRTIIGPDGGKVGNALKGFFKDKFGKQTRVTFDDPVFEKHFAVFTTDFDEACRLVSPGFCKALLALTKVYTDDTLGAAFVDGVFLLAVPVDGDLFEPGSITRSVHDCEDDIHTFLGELTIAHRVIEILLGDPAAEPSAAP